MLEEVEKDPFLRPFTSANFDVASHVTSLLSSTSSSISELSKHIAAIEQQIHSNVSSNHGCLLAQTTNVELMESVVQNCNQRSNACYMSVGNIKTRLEDLHTECGKQVDYLENLYATDEAARRIASVIEIDRRVAQEKNTSDVAACVVQIEYLCLKQPKLDFLQPYHDKATSLRQNIEKQTENILNQGLNANSVSQVSSCLQILINLDVLEEKIVKVFGEIEKLIERDVKLALDVKVQVPINRGAGGAVRSVLPATSVAVGQIWNNLEAVSNKLVNHTNKVKLIWKAVQSGKDTASNLSYIDFIPSGELVFKKFWDNFMDIQIRHFPAVKQDFLKAAFDNEFPRLLKIFAELGSKIEEGSDVQIQSSLRGVISNYEKAYLSKSLAKLFDAVNQNFVTLPTKSGLDTILRMIRSEIQVDDPMLKRLMARNVSKTVNLICVKAEQLVATDGPATDSQRSNAQLVNMLDYFKSQLKDADAVNNVEILMQNTINPLVIAVGEAIEAIIQTMHNENFQRSNSNRATEYSLYMGELQSFVARASKEYFSLYKLADLVQKCGVQLASHTIDLFIRHVCLLAPLHLESTRNQILTDLNQLEIALTPTCPVLSELGKPYKLLKGFKSLLGMKMEEIVGSSIVGSAVGYSCAIHLLYRFARDEMKMPHSVNGWSITRYSKWLDEHPSEADRLSLLKAALESYVHTVRSKGQQNFCTVYPHMMTLLQKGLVGQ
ncbi:Conserved oligomeric Golgi complex subunit 5 [Orchesella cincta]|uniref:Conserved oligomeric Golgi complex subunit 5 n=1 Tax=Orchesella cincta TaxID=48709 RepID=A0A1D2MNC4_ORCCI|nr:Conserved oligomeric Golgi complex subunit 5 [Orchesella cincta]